MSKGKKGMAALIVASAKPAKPMEEAPEADPKHAAAEELMEAIQSGDAAAVADAFSSMMELCSHSEME
jgi:hypothetical protein